MKLTEKKPELIQMPFRCEPDLHIRIIRALGNTMGRSGRKISKNDFVVQLIERGLSGLEGGS